MLTGQSLSLLHDFCLASNPRKEDDSLMGPSSDTRLGAEPVMQQPDQSLSVPLGHCPWLMAVHKVGRNV